MADRANFIKDVKAISAEADEDKRELIERLKHMTPAEFVRLPRRDLERLTVRQYAGIAASIAPNARLPEAPPNVIVGDGKVSKPSPFWSNSSVRVVIAAAVTALCVVFLVPPIMHVFNTPVMTRSTNAMLWPICRRLTPETDGCRYRPVRNLPWGYVAQILQMDEIKLISLNPNLPNNFAPAGHDIVVWRGLGRLETSP